MFAPPASRLGGQLPLLPPLSAAHDYNTVTPLIFGVLLVWPAMAKPGGGGGSKVIWQHGRSLLSLLAHRIPC